MLIFRLRVTHPIIADVLRTKANNVAGQSQGGLTGRDWQVQRCLEVKVRVVSGPPFFSPVR